MVKLTVLGTAAFRSIPNDRYKSEEKLTSHSLTHSNGSLGCLHKKGCECHMRKNVLDNLVDINHNLMPRFKFTIEGNFNFITC